MKHIKYIAFALLLPLLAGCYADKGNYTYKDLASVEVKVTGIESAYKVKSMGTLEISPVISPDNADYEYYWGVYPAGSLYIDKMIIISRERNLKYSVQLKPGNYQLRFYAKDKQTGVFSYTEYDLTVETDIVSGWWLLKEVNGNTDIDIHTPKHVFPNRLAEVSGKSLEGAPRGFLFYDSWLRLDSVGEGSDKKYTNTPTPSLFVASDKDLKVLDYYTTETIGTFESLFKLNSSVQKKPEDIFFATNYISLVNNGRIHSLRTIGQVATSFFGEAFVGDYKLSPHRAVAFSWQPILYDESKSSFCSYARIDNSLQYFKDPAPHKVNNLNADLLFFNHRKMLGVPEWAYALLKSKTTSEHYLYKFGSMFDRVGMKLLQVDVLRDDKKMFHADRYAYTKGYNQTFFSIGNVIWSCEFAGFTEKEQLTVPAGETITLIETLVPDVPSGTQAPVYFVLGTQTGNRYKFSVYNVQAGNIAERVALYEGEGNVKRAMFIEMKDNRIWQTLLD
ncbi:MAG: PKD-like family lipoprotein [Bacteroidia bacterium]|nr:PKD-like family lipoprotein [Bacteroidia bacterium]